MTDPPESVPCSRCGWPVLPNAIQCYVCGEREPGAYTSSPTLSTLVRLKHAWRQQWDRLLNRLGLRQHRPLNPSGPRPAQVAPEVSYISGIIVTCIVLYGLAIGLDVISTQGIRNVLTPSDLALYRLGMTGRFPVLNGRWWTPITAIYLHGGLLHIMFNMLAVYQVGPLVQRLFGSYRFFLLYTLSGVFGALVSTLMGTALTVGASGAIFGLMGALIYYGYRVRQLPRFLPILRWAAINFVLGMITPQVDNWGHAGGFVGGVLIAMALMAHRNSRYDSTLYRGLATLALVLTVIAFGLSLVVPTGLTY